MINAKFVNELKNNRYFNSLLKEIVNFVQIGCLIISLVFILSIIIFPVSIKITIWITIISWFLLIMISNNYFLFEKDNFFKQDKNQRIINDVYIIKSMIKNYNFNEKDIKELINYLNSKRKEKKLNWLVLIIPVILIPVIFSNCLIFKTKISYVIIISIFTLFMNHFINYINSGIHNKEQCNYNYILFCLDEIKLEKLT